MNNVLFLLLGWALGLFSPIITEVNKRHREGLQVKKALFGELHELKYQLACAGYLAEMQFGTVDRNRLEWMRDVMNKYKGNYPKDSILKSIEGQLALSDKEIAIVAKHSLAKAEKGLALKKFIVPLLDSQVSIIWFFEKKFQNSLLDIRSQLNLLNEDVEQARFYFGLTFNHLKGDDPERVRDNLFQCYKEFAYRARIIVDKIIELEASVRL